MNNLIDLVVVDFPITVFLIKNVACVNNTCQSYLFSTPYYNLHSNFLLFLVLHFEMEHLLHCFDMSKRLYSSVDFLANPNSFV